MNEVVEGSPLKRKWNMNHAVNQEAIEMGVKFAIASLYANGWIYPQDRGSVSEMWGYAGNKVYFVVTFLKSGTQIIGWALEWKVFKNIDSSLIGPFALVGTNIALYVQREMTLR